MKSLKEIYHSVVASYEAAKTRKEQERQLRGAIAHEDLAGVQEILKTARFADAQQDGLLMAAIDSGNPSIFEAVLDSVAGGNRNHRLSRDDSSLRNGITTLQSVSLLGYAIEKKSHLVAWALASDERTDITDAAISTETTRVSGGFMSTITTIRTANTCNKALEMAKTAGMNDVAVVLARREAFLKRQEAAILEMTAICLGK